MAKKIIWSPRAKKDRWEILEYWHNRNRSKNYSRKLFRKFQEAVQQIASHPEIGKITSFEKIRSFIVQDYLIIYEEFPDHILILVIWHSRQDPNKLEKILG